MGIKFILVLLILMVASIEDIKKREVSNLASLFILIISLYKLEPINIIGLILCPMPLVLTNLKVKNNFGGADIKIMASLGLYLGSLKGLLVLLIALTLETIIKYIKKKESQPMIPYILIGFIIIGLV